MADPEPVATEPLDADDARVTPWTEARRRLAEADSYWLATVRPDGRRPHVMPVLGVWLDGALYFSTRETSRKGRNLAGRPHCVVTVGSLVLPALDLVLEGDASKVTDEAKLHRVAGMFASKYGWQVTVRDGAFYGDGAPTAGPPPYAVYEVTPAVVFGFPGVTGTDSTGQGTEGSWSATRWRFS